MSTMGRRQTNADNDKLDLSKKTIRDVAIELARRSQPAAPSPPSAQHPSRSAPGGPVMPLVSPNAGPTDEDQSRSSNTWPAAAEKSATGADQASPRNSAGDEGAMSAPTAVGPETGDAKLIKMGLRENQLQGTQMPGAWVAQRPFKEDVTGRAPLEALSRALDHWQIDQQDEFSALTPSSEMTTDLGPAPMVVAATPAAEADEAVMPGQGAVSSSSVSKTTKSKGTVSNGTVRMAAADDGHRRPGLRHFPARPSRLKKFFDTNLNTLQSVSFGLASGFASSRTMRQSTRKRLHPLGSRLARLDWPTLAGGLVIGTLVGLGVAAIVLPVATPAGYGARSPAAPVARSEAPAATPGVARALPSEAMAPTADNQAASNQAVGNQAAVDPAQGGNQAQGNGAAGTRTRPSIASTVGIPAALQPSGPAILGSVPTVGAPAAPMADTALPKAAPAATDATAIGDGSTAQPTTPPKPAKATNKSSTKSTAKRTNSRQTTVKAEEPLSSAKR